MARDIKTLLSKKGWTGDEVGRAMIADLVKSYYNLLHSGATDNTGLLTDAEKSRLVDSLTEQGDIRRYNEYRYIHDYVVTIPMRYTLAQQIAESCFWRLYSFLGNTHRAESSANNRRFEPHIVTQAQYDKLKHADFEKKMNWGYSIELLMLHSIGYFLREYKNGKKTPFNKYFTSAKKQPITNPRIKATYWADGEGGYYKYPDGTTSKDTTPEERMEKIKAAHAQQESLNAFSTREPTTIDQIIATIHQRTEADAEREQQIGEWVEDLTAPEDATLFNVLECIDGFYSSAETDSDQTFFEIEKDFPEFYKAIWDYLIKLKPLAFIKDTPKEEYVKNTDLISVKALYDNNVLDFREWLDVFDPTLDLDGYGGGIAVLQPSGASYPTHRINEAGEYAPDFDPQEYYFNTHRAEALIEQADVLTEWLDTIKSRYRDMYALHAFLALTSEFCKVDGLEVLIEPVEEKYINTLNYYLDNIRHDLYYNRTGEGSIPVEELREQLQALFKPIKISDLQPTEDAIAEARRSMSFKTFQGNATYFIEDSIKRGGGEE